MKTRRRGEARVPAGAKVGGGPGLLAFLLLAASSVVVLLGLQVASRARLEARARGARQTLGAHLGQALQGPSVLAEGFARAPTLRTCLEKSLDASRALPSAQPVACEGWTSAPDLLALIPGLQEVVCGSDVGPACGWEATLSFRLRCGPGADACPRPDHVEFRIDVAPGPQERDPRERSVGTLSQGLQTLMRGSPRTPDTEGHVLVPAHRFALAPRDVPPWTPQWGTSAPAAPRSETSTGGGTRAAPRPTPSHRRPPPVELRPKRNPADTTARAGSTPAPATDAHEAVR